MTNKKHDIELINEVVLTLKAEFDRSVAHNTTYAAEAGKAIAQLLNAKANIAASYNFDDGVNSRNCGGVAVFGPPPKQG